MAKKNWLFAALTAAAMVGCGHSNSAKSADPAPQPTAATPAEDSGDIQKVRGTDENLPAGDKSEYPSGSPAATPDSTAPMPNSTSPTPLPDSAKPDSTSTTPLSPEPTDSKTPAPDQGASSMPR